MRWAWPGGTADCEEEKGGGGGGEAADLVFGCDVTKAPIPLWGEWLPGPGFKRTAVNTGLATRLRWDAAPPESGMKCNDVKMCIIACDL